MTIGREIRRLAILASLSIVCLPGSAVARQTTELPKPSEIPGVRPEVLLRSAVPNAPHEVLIVSRTTYKPGVHVAWHRHASQIVFYVLQGTMGLQDKGKAPFTLEAGRSLLIKPGTVHQHWNTSSTQPLVFLEYVLVKPGQPSAVFIK
ncbi:MAG: cupin domain-containing protein [Rhizomicrobium sp.]